MSTKPFQFKEFTICQDKTAMKIGTDGVLLGAWLNIKKEVNSILDIGTGTGILALQAAQRSPSEIIDALEIEANAYEQAVQNFENSNWGDRLFCYHASLQEFVIEIEDKYDLIISNPPYYDTSYKSLNKNRTLARQNKTLTFKELLSATAQLLKANGTCAFIIPYKEEINFLKLAEDNNLFPQKLTRVKGNISNKIKRTLLQLSFNRTKIEFDELSIEIERHVYTDNYKKLVADFYLNF